MSSLPPYALVLALSFGCAIFPPAAHCQTKAAKKILTNSVSGRITIHGKGAAGISVGIRSSDFSMPPRPTLKATTDADGNYRLIGIPAGNYQVLPIAPIYVVPDQTPARSSGKTLLLAEGEDVQNIDFSLERGGVISGKVTDADGRPVIEEPVSVLSEGQAKLRGQDFASVVTERFQTDDRGVYRIYGIPQGRYKIAVGQADGDPYSNPRFGRVAYRRTFYRSGTEAGDATVVEVNEGSETNNIDLILDRGLPSFAASGRVVDGETGQPIMGLRLGLRRVIDGRETGDVLGILTASNSQGEFRLENVTPGKYFVFVVPQTGNEVRVEGVPFEVVDQEVTGLVIKTVKGLSISGTVVLEGISDKSVLNKLSELRLQAYVRSDTGESGSGQASPLNADGSFRIGGLPAGIANFFLTTQDRRPPVNFTIVRVERDGIVPPRGLEVKAGENVSGVRIALSYGTGSIRGEVKLENGPLPQNGRLVVWIKKLEETGSSFRTHDVDARGHFLIEGVPAGSHELNVNVNIPGRRNSPPVTQVINVTEGAATNVDVTVDLKFGQGQLP
jgi:hypothetical protein